MRTLYSDTNFIVLGKLVQRVSGVALDRYVRQHILAPLGMHDTDFRPAGALLARTAPTETLAGAPLLGVVHDPTARRMGGVAGHAGLFGSADDLALFAQSLLRHEHVLTPASIAAMQQPQGPAEEADPRGLDWVPPSPNLRKPATAVLYPDVALIEGANVSVGRGTTHPFEWLGAPWIDGRRPADALNEAAPAGVHFAPLEFTPDAAPFRGRRCHGVQIQVVDRGQLDAPLLGTLLAGTLARLWPDQFALDAIDAMLGSQQTLSGLHDGVTAATLAAQWQPRLDEFRALRERFLLY